MQVIWTDPALERVDETAVYIAQDDPAAADRWTLELIFGAYRVFYRVGSAVEVLSVRHGSQLIRAHEVCED